MRARSSPWSGLLCGLLLAGCGKGPSQSETAAGSPTWALDSVPSVAIGVAEGEEPYELAGASSSLRLADGRIVIANSGTSQLRTFDRTGKYVKSIGRKGEGPGEFTGSLQMAAISLGEFAVFDQIAQRLSVFDTTGSLVRESRILSEKNSDFPLWIWLHGTAWVSGPMDTSLRAGVRGVLDNLPTPSPGAYRYVQVATDGRIWFQERLPTAAAPQPWIVLSPTGESLGQVLLPEGTEVHQISRDFVLLRHWGENDVEHIQLYRFQEGEAGGQTAPGGRTSAGPGPVADSSVRITMAGAMRNLVMAQEMFYADSARYARAAGGLNWEGPPGTSLHLMAADKRGWVGALVHQSQPILCGMAVGGSTPPGWSEGSPKCSR